MQAEQTSFLFGANAPFIEELYARFLEERLPDGRAKMRILRAVDRARAREFLPVASGPAVRADVAESVPYLAPAAERVRTRRSVLLSPHVAGAAPGFARRALAEASRCATPSDRTPVVLGGRGHRAGG